MIPSKMRVIVGVVCFLLCTAACCTEDVVTEATSPDGKLRAYVTVQNCGGTEPYRLDVNIRPAHGFVGPFGLGMKNVLAQENADSAELQWVGNRELLIRAQHGEVFGLVDRWEDVTVRAIYKDDGTPVVLR